MKRPRALPAAFSYMQPRGDDLPAKRKCRQTCPSAGEGKGERKSHSNRTEPMMSSIRLLEARELPVIRK